MTDTAAIADQLESARRKMVEQQLAARGISDAAVLDAMGKVPRHLFVPEHRAACAYDDRPLPIGSGQTISQPFVVALMAQALALTGNERVLEIGTGSGYAASVLAEIAGEVYTIERIAALARRAGNTLAEHGYDNVHVICGDGTLGWPDAAPYEGIVVTAGAPRVPEALKRQLAIGGRLVIPVEEGFGAQLLLRVTRMGENAFETEDLGGVRFVPLIGEQGWRSGTGADDSDPHSA